MATRKQKPGTIDQDRRNHRHSAEGTTLRKSRMEPPSAELATNISKAPASQQHSVNLPGLGDSTDAKSTGFRRARRSGIVSHWSHTLHRLGWASMLPLVIVLAGSLAAWFLVGQGASAAIITFITAALAMLSLIIPGRQTSSVSTQIRQRFEFLEDIAWELRESEERYRTMVEAFGDLMVIRDAAGKMVDCSDNYAACVGKPLEEVIENNIDLFAGSPQNPGDVIGAATAAGSTREVRVEAQGRELWFQVLDVPIRDTTRNGSAILSVARDITSFKRTELLQAEAAQKAEEASQSKSRFLAMVSHEMRTPLNGIVGMSRLLSGTPLTGEQASYNKALEQSGKTLLHLIEDMLDITMIEAGRFETREDVFELRPLMDAILELMSPQAFDRNIGIGLFVDPSLPDSVFGDQGRLRQILVNLIGNAMKFTETGGVEVHCGWASQGVGSTSLRFLVKDSGPGMKPQDRERIFGEFERLDNRITRHEAGAGLGLTISRALARQLGGTLELLETGKKGSVFQLEIPLQTVGKPEPSQQEPQLNERQILVVSSNRNEANCLIRTIRAHGAKVRVADGVDSLNAALEESTQSYDNILFDPKDWSNSENEMLRIRNQASSAILTVLLPAGQRDQFETYKKSGAGSWLIRPVREASLLAVLNGQGRTDARAEQHLPARWSMNQAANGARVLLAEDNDINALLAMSVLKKSGYAVTRVLNGRDAVREYLSSLGGADSGKSAYSSILMDMHMPVLDGRSAVVEIRTIERTRSLPSVPIYILTADEQSSTRSSALEAGASDLLVKPLDPARLLELVSGAQSKPLKQDALQSAAT